MPDRNFDYFSPLLREGQYLNNGRYEIISNTVNAGGFGRIYRAYDHKSNKDGMSNVVAIKEFYVEEFFEDSDRSRSIGVYTKKEMGQCIKLMRENFRKEADILSRLNEQHDRHVPSIHGKVFSEEGRLFYAMTYIDGLTLRETVEQEGIMTEEMAVNYIVQIGKVLYKAHQWNVMHCDISPNNIMLENNCAVLVDFGNAKSYDLLLASLNNDSVDQAVQMGEIGTPGFCAPSLFIGSPRGDIYSLAATLYYLLTGKIIDCLSSQKRLDDARANLEKKKVSKETIHAILHAMEVNLENGSMGSKEFLEELPNKIVFNTLLNYNDYDYNKRQTTIAES